MDVRMPDGTIIRNVPEGITRSELQRRLEGRPREPEQNVVNTPALSSEHEAMRDAARSVGVRLAGGQETPGMQTRPDPPAQQAPQDGPTFWGSFGRTALTRYLSNIGALPHLAANALTPRPVGEGQIPDPLQLASAAIRGVTGYDPTAAAEETRARGGLIPRIEGTDILAASRTLAEPSTGEPMSARFRQAQANEEAAAQRMAQEQPAASMMGGLAGDAATLFTGRLPGARAGRTPTTPSPAAATTPGAQRLATRVLESPAVQRLARGAGRSVETGLEGVALSILNDGDPLEVGALSAGGQMAGSIMLTAGEGLVSGGVLKAGLKIGLAAGAATSLIQLGKTALPGGKDYILESMEAGFEKVMFAMVGGMLGGLAGAGRLRTGSGAVRDKFAEDVPRVAEFLTTIPRGATISFLNEVLSSNTATQENIQAVYAKLAEDPNYFGKATARRLDRAFRDERISVAKTIDDLMDKRFFRERVDALSAQ